MSQFFTSKTLHKSFYVQFKVYPLRALRYTPLEKTSSACLPDWKHQQHHVSLSYILRLHRVEVSTFRSDNDLFYYVV